MKTPLMGGSGGAVFTDVYLPVVGESSNAASANLTEVIPTSGTISGLTVTLSRAPGSTYSRTVTLYKNGSATALAVTITGSATTGSDLSDSISVAAGDYVYYMEQQSSSYAALTTVYCGAVFQGTDTTESVVMACYGVLSSSTCYFVPSGYANNSSSSTASLCPCPTAGTFKKFYTLCTTSVASTSALTLQINGSATALTSNLSTTALTATGDTSDTVSVSAGNTVNVSAAQATGGYSAFSWSFVFVPTTAGESIHFAKGMLSQTVAPAEGVMTAATTEANASVMCPVSCTAYSLYVQVEAVSNITSTLYLRDNAANTTLTVALSSASSGNDTTHQPVIAAGDLLAIGCWVATYYQNVGYVLYASSGGNVTVTPGAGSFSFSFSTPPVVTPANSPNPTPANFSLSLSLATPAVVTPANNVSAAPASFSLSTAFSTPPVVTPANSPKITPAAVSFSTSFSTPQVITPSNSPNITPAALSLTFTGATPSVTTPVVVNPGSFSLTLTGSTPTVSTPVVVNPGSFSLTLTGSTPTVSTPVAVNPGSFSLTLTGSTPTVSTPVSVTPAAANFTFTGSVPTVTAGGSQTVQPAAFSLSTSWNTPAVAVGGSQSLQPAAMTLTMTGAVPSLTLTNNQYINPAALSLTWTGAVPSVSATANITLLPGALAFTLAGAVPNVSIGFAIIDWPIQTSLRTRKATTSLNSREANASFRTRKATTSLNSREANASFRTRKTNITLNAR